MGEDGIRCVKIKFDEAREVCNKSAMMKGEPEAGFLDFLCEKERKPIIIDSKKYSFEDLKEYFEKYNYKMKGHFKLLNLGDKIVLIKGGVTSV